MAEESKGSPPDNLAELYAKLRREFTATDLQKYTELEDGIPAVQLLAELEEIHRQESQPRTQD